MADVQNFRDSDSPAGKNHRVSSSNTSERSMILSRNRQEMSRMLSSLIPASDTAAVFHKYQDLLDVPFISMSEILITREIGAGSFGRVFHGIFSFQDVAVKKLTARNFKDEIDIYDKLTAQNEDEEVDEPARHVAQTLLALEKEVGMLKRITFPKVVGFYGVCFEPAAIVSEYCARGSLFDLIAKARSNTRMAKEMSWQRRLRLANDAAIGMNFLHNRRTPIIHKDLKSPNLLVDEHFNCKIADFNTAGFIDMTEITKSQANNPRWLAPEIADSKPHTKASDVYPFGIILWELMTWRRPFEDLSTFGILLGIVQQQLRPEDVPNSELPGGECPVYNAYVDLMKECWDQDPDLRPPFHEIHKRLEDMIRLVDSEPQSQSHGPGIAKSPRTASPFAAKPIPEVPITNERQTSNVPAETAPPPPPTTGGHSTEECFTSPFQNGPPSLDNSSNLSFQERTQDTQLVQPPSFNTWSTQMSAPKTQQDSTIVEFSDVVQNCGGDRSSNARRLWDKVKNEFDLSDWSPSPTQQCTRALNRWDSVRTAIFGDPTSDGFKEQFKSFLAGDETTELKKRLKDVDTSKRSPGVRIIKALMELREAKKREEDEKNKKDQAVEEGEETYHTGWGLVKHLMVLNLPPPVHPLWRELASSIKHRASSTSSLDPIEEGRRSRGRQLWKFVREMLLDADIQPTTPQLHPRWQTIKEILFQGEEESEEPEKQEAQAQKTEVPITSQSSSRQKPGTKWNVVRSMFLPKAVEQNLTSLAKYARRVVPPKTKTDRPIPAEIRKQFPTKSNRRVAVVDDESPSPEKWELVRNLLNDDTLGSEWKTLRDKAQKNKNPPRGTEWELFRWLFFENKTLRNQHHWSIIKDLFLKPDLPDALSSDPF